MHHVFIVNPKAGKGRALQMIDRINSRFKDLDQPFEVKITEAPGHAKEIAAKAVESHEALRLYSVGGDGTLNEVVNGMAGSHAELGIIPCGSGNDAVRSIYPITDPVELIKTLPTSPSVTLDIGKLNDKFFLNIASIGFDAEVVLKSHAFKRLPFVSGSMAYVLGILSALIRLNKHNIDIDIYEDPEIPVHMERDVLMTVFANGSYYGGGMKPAPRAEMNDGILDFCIVQPITRLEVLKFFPLFKRGEHEPLHYVKVMRGTKAVIESHKPFPVNVDGEVNMESRVSVEILPGFVSIIVPRLA